MRTQRQLETRATPVNRRTSCLSDVLALRDRLPTQKVVVLTATANPQVRRHCEAMGVDGVFDKGMETEALLDYCMALSRAAGGH